MKELLKKIFGMKKSEHDYKVVHIYARKDDELSIIPTGESKKHRLTTDLDILLNLAPPYTEEELEHKIFEALELCFSYEPEDISYKTNAEKANASKKYNKKVKGSRLVSIFWNKSDGYKVEPFEKAKSRGYTIMSDKIICLGHNIEKGMMGKAIKKALEDSKPY